MAKTVIECCVGPQYPPFRMMQSFPAVARVLGLILLLSTCAESTSDRRSDVLAATEVFQHTRSLEAVNPSITLRLLVTNLPQDSFKDGLRKAFLETLSQLAGVDGDKVSITAVEKVPAPPPVVVECDTERYVCGEHEFLQRRAYLASVQGDCIEFGDAQLVLCGSDLSAPLESDSSKRLLLAAKKSEPFIVVAEIITESNAEALAVRSYAVSVLDNKDNEALTLILRKNGLWGISLKLVSDPEFNPATVTYNWRVGRWELCSVMCGGGTQRRAVTCHSNHHVEQVGNWLCSEEDKPHGERFCNQQSCELQLFQFSEMAGGAGACSKSCGGGVSYSSFHCVANNGYVGKSDYCGESNGKPLTKACSSAPCEESTEWESVSWGKCSKKCGGGEKQINRKCMEDGRTVEDDLCEGSATVTAPCNTAPCSIAYWDTQPWGQCDKPCGAGRMHRVATCKNENGDDVDEILCPPKPSVEAQCNLQRCNFCQGNNCSKRGSCENGACKCYQGFKGTLCELPDTCGGVLDKNKKCCDSGILDGEGVCCSAESLVSVDGQCCNKLDAGGKCSGKALFLSFDDRSCETLLDAEGFCCNSGVLDDCGVCDGDSSSCSSSVTLLAQVLDPAALTNRTNFHDGIESFIRGKLEIREGALRVVASEFINKASSSSVVRATVDIEPETTTTNGAVISSQFIWSVLTGAVGDVIPGYGLFDSVESISRPPVCGNQLCETGEREIYTKNVDGSKALVAGCSNDCKLPYKECPVGDISSKSTPDFCSAHGLCRSASGECDCWDGYTGTDCSLCEQGYVRSGPLCVPQFTVEGVKFAPTDGASVFANPLTVLILCVSVFALVALIAGTVLLKRSRKDILSNSNPPNHPKKPRKQCSTDTLSAARGLSYHVPRALSSPLLSGMPGRSVLAPSVLSPQESVMSGTSLHLSPSKRGTTCGTEIAGVSSSSRCSHKRTARFHDQELDSLVQEKLSSSTRAVSTHSVTVKKGNIAMLQCPTQAMPDDIGDGISSKDLQAQSSIEESQVAEIQIEIKANDCSPQQQHIEDHNEA